MTLWDAVLAIVFLTALVTWLLRVSSNDDGR
jgi:hypothetical protein